MAVGDRHSALGRVMTQHWIVRADGRYTDFLDKTDTVKAFDTKSRDKKAEDEPGRSRDRPSLLEQSSVVPAIAHDARHQRPPFRLKRPLPVRNNI